MSQRRVIVCFAGDVWDGNPHSRHHLMRRLAPRFDVLFVEGVPMRSVARGDGHELRRVLAKVRQGWSLRTVAPGLYTLRPAPLPPAGRLGRRLQVEALRVQIELALRRLDLRGPRLAWFSLPIAAPLLGRLGEQASVLYYQDRYDEFSHVDAALLRGHVAALAAGCDVSIASAEPLAADLRALGASPVVIRHGVEVDRFASPGAVPADLEALERPIVGCVGLIDDHMDLPALRAIADSLERGTLALVGGTNIALDALRHPRIALLGRRPYTDMPAYVNGFDCCIVPFAAGPLTEAVNPIKLREYLAAGRPVVSTDMPEVRRYAPTVRLASTTEEWIAEVHAALAPAEATPDRRRARYELVAGETWDAAAAAVEAELDRVLPA
jgi:glycosyltransferase involved in cell wall biosynthesis